MTENEIRDLFREMRDEEIPPDSLARVRLRVSERTEVRKVFGPWKIAALLVAMGCVVFAMLWRRTTSPIPVPAAPVVARSVAPQQTSAVEAPIERARPVARRAVKPVRHVERTLIAGGAKLIRIETPDPDVVILLIGD
jgi:hypothetical protein